MGLIPKDNGVESEDSSEEILEEHMRFLMMIVCCLFGFRLVLQIHEVAHMSRIFVSNACIPKLVKAQGVIGTLHLGFCHPPCNKARLHLVYTAHIGAFLEIWSRPLRPKYSSPSDKDSRTGFLMFRN